MKKTISMLLVLAVLLSAAYAFAQDNVLSAEVMEEAAIAEVLEDVEDEEIMQEELMDLYGEIIEITEEYVLLDTADFGYVQVNLSEDTVIEGVELLEIGQTAVVMYNGQMTRSLPPQITALHIGVYAVSGVIAEVLEDSIVLIQDETGEEIIITLPQHALLGENEELIESEETDAETEEIDETDEIEQAEADAEDAGDDADEIVGEDENAMPELNVGDAVIVYTNGAATMSLPPQMNALAIVLDLGEATPGEAQAEETEAEFVG